MSNYLDLEIRQINKLLKEKKIKVTDLVQEAFDKIEASDLNAFITLNKEEALKEAKELDEEEVDNLLFGIPIAIKDNILTKDLKTTAGSSFLENFLPVFDATVIKKLKDKKMIIIGKTNMDEFAMGSNGETSFYGKVINPLSKKISCGGSSSGSAVAVSANQVRFALGTDTGGSIREPASYTMTVGLKPTYGRVSRYGLIAYGSSLDQIGPMTKTVYENALLLGAISAKDEKDLTSVSKEDEDFTRLIGTDLSQFKVALLESDDQGLNNKIKTILDQSKITYEKIQLKSLKYSHLIYRIIASAEGSSNLARFDGLRYGKQAKKVDSLEELYLENRSNYFGSEVKSRIILGAYFLQKENYEKYYLQATKLRNVLKKEYQSILNNYDFIIKIDSFKEQPDEDFSTSLNLTALPGLSLPVGRKEECQIQSLQIVADYFKEAEIYAIAASLEESLGDENV